MRCPPGCARMALSAAYRGKPRALGRQRPGHVGLPGATGKDANAVPTTPVPPGFLPDTWAGSETVQVDLTPLGQINQLAIDQVTLTAPSTVAGGGEPAVPLTMLALRVRLLLRTTPPEVRDQAWRYIGQ